MSTKSLPLLPQSGRPQPGKLRQRLLYGGQIILFLIIIGQFAMLYRNYLVTAIGAVASGTSVNGEQVGNSEKVPDYFQTSPKLWAGPTPTGPAPFLAQTNAAPFESTSYIPNTPLETQTPITGQTKDGNIFELLGELSHYFPNPDGFGVDEFTLPKGAEIVQLNMLSRHGARYPTMHHGVMRLAEKIANFTKGQSAKTMFKGELDFLNEWEYTLGNEILVPIGKEELFESGTLHQYMYGHLYPNDGSKIIARSTTQDRMTQSAEYFLAGFFGLEWTKNATLLLAIEHHPGLFNNTLAGYLACPNANKPVNRAGPQAMDEWSSIYLADATKRLNEFAPGFNWTYREAHHAQSLCAFETVAVGYSPFCSLFTYEEWEGYEYSVDLDFAGLCGFQSPVGRAVGIGYVQELLARLDHHLITEPVAQVNTTLDGSESTFPLDQALNFDFSHDTNIMAILTAFGLTQFSRVLPTDHIDRERDLIVSHVTPFAARLDIEVIRTPAPVDGVRTNGDTYLEGEETKYIHFVLNQRTIPLGRSFPECGQRDDGWCELDTFLQVQRTKLDEAMYEYSCYGEYPAVPFGKITNGVPLKE